MFLYLLTVTLIFVGIYLFMPTELQLVHDINIRRGDHEFKEALLSLHRDPLSKLVAVIAILTYPVTVPLFIVIDVLHNYRNTSIWVFMFYTVLLVSDYVLFFKG